MRVALLFAAFVSVVPAVSSAQSINSPDDIIRQLHPTARGASRGIRSVPGPAVANPDAAAPTAHAGTVRGGIAHPTATRAVAASPVPSMTAAEPSQAGDLAALNMQVQFATGSDHLTPQAARTLSMLGKALADQQLAGLSFRIEGTH